MLDRRDPGLSDLIGHYEHRPRNLLCRGVVGEILHIVAVRALHAERAREVVHLAEQLDVRVLLENLNVVQLAADIRMRHRGRLGAEVQRRGLVDWSVALNGVGRECPGILGPERRRKVRLFAVRCLRPAPMDRRGW